MIHVTQGHEKGIGLEVFFKSILYLEKEALKNFIFHGFRKTVRKTLESINIPHKINEDDIVIFNKSIAFRALDKGDSPESTHSLLSALNCIKESDVLITLPTSKTELIQNGKHTAGYTEFFRSYFKNKDITMVFYGPFGFTALLTDHIPLAKVSEFIDSQLIKNKITIIIDGLDRFFKKPKQVIVAGINPHAGEGGVLGHEDSIFKTPLKELSEKYKDISFIGPLPGDTLHFESEDRENKLFLYAFHDQGLPSFKAQSGLFGINISLGMPFIRLSVDHGTAFPLYGKNSADCRGCLFTLQKALQVNNDY